MTDIAALRMILKIFEWDHLLFFVASNDANNRLRISSEQIEVPFPYTPSTSIPPSISPSSLTPNPKPHSST